MDTPAKGGPTGAASASAQTIKKKRRSRNALDADPGEPPPPLTSDAILDDDAEEAWWWLGMDTDADNERRPEAPPLLEEEDAKGALPSLLPEESALFSRAPGPPWWCSPVKIGEPDLFEMILLAPPEADDDTAVMDDA
jgi:hypothetical protein